MPFEAVVDFDDRAAEEAVGAAEVGDDNAARGDSGTSDFEGESGSDE
jgi:hypothetical protein